MKMYRKTAFTPINRFPPQFTLAFKYRKDGKVSYVYRHFKYEQHLEAHAEQYMGGHCDKCLIAHFCPRRQFVNLLSD